jgi:hypothetical protein
MNKTIKLLFITALSGLMAPVYAAPELIITNNQATPSSLQYPVNTTIQPNIYLHIEIPAGFRALQTPQQLATPGNVIAEFVPKNDDDYKWTQIITGVTIKGSHITADDLVKYMQDKFKETATAVKIVDSTSQAHNNYQQACTTMDYEINSRHEIVYMCYYCGPDDCAGIQNAMLWPTETNITSEKMAARLKPFVANDVSVITAKK